MKTVSKELSIKLRDAGFPQNEAEYSYQLSKSTNIWLQYCDQEDRRRIERKDDGDFYFVSAPSADEMLNFLPVMIKDRFAYFFNIQKDDKDTWSIYYEYNNLVVDVVLKAEGKKTPDKIRGLFKGTLADAAAQMWLYLEEKNLLQA